MPPVVAAAAAVAGGVANAFFAVGLGVGLSTYAAGTLAVFATQALGYATQLYLLNRVGKALAPKAPKGGVQGGQSMEVNYYDSVGDGRIIVGSARIGGLQCIPPITTGTNNEYLHQVLALAIHEVDGFDDVYFDQDRIDGSYIGGVSGTGGDGSVSTLSGSPYGGKANIRRYAGTSTQSVDFILNDADPTAFPSTFRGRGIAYAAIRYQFDDKVYRSIPNATFEVRGLKCYDPRLDTTNGGSGSHRYATPSTWAYTENPALILSTLAMSSMMWELDPATEIVWSLVAAAANICDAAVAIPGSTTQPRYTANGLLLATNEPTENARIITDAMLGRHFFRDGKLHIYAGAYTTPSFAIEKSDWIGPLTISTVQPRGEGRWNGVRCFFVDADNNTQRKECYARTNSTYTTQDGNDRIWIEMEQPLCNNEYEAQRKAEMTLRQSRNQIRISGRLPPRFQTLGTFETGGVTFDDLGWASKVFRLVNWDLNEDGSVSVALVEEQSADWDDMLAADYGTQSTAALPATNPTAPSAPATFEPVPQINGTILFQWAASTIKPVGTEYRIIRSTNSADASVGTVVWQGNQLLNPLVMPASRHFYYIQAVAGSYFSEYTPNTYGIAITALPQADRTVQQIELFQDGMFAFGASGSYWSQQSSYGARVVGSMTYVSTGGVFGGPYINFSRANSPLGVGYAAINAVFRETFPNVYSGAAPWFRRPIIVDYEGFARCASGNNGTLYVGLAIESAAVGGIAGHALANTTAWQYFSGRFPTGVAFPNSAPGAIGAVGYLGTTILGYGVDIGFVSLKASQNQNDPVEPLGLGNGTGANYLSWYQTLCMITADPTSLNPTYVSVDTGQLSYMPIGTRFAIKKIGLRNQVVFIPPAGATLYNSETATTGTYAVPAANYQSMTLEKIADTSWMVRVS